MIINKQRILNTVEEQKKHTHAYIENVKSVCKEVENKKKQTKKGVD